MKKNQHIFFLIFILIVSYSCEKDRNSPILKPVNSKTQFADSTYFSWCWNIHAHEESFFVGDYENGRIIQFNTNLKKINQFGKQGKGPGEFNGAGAVYVHEDTIYAYDDAGSRFHIYNSKGKYLNTLNTPRMDMISRFFVSNNNLYIPIHRREFLLQVINKEEKVKKEIGEDIYNHIPIERESPNANLTAHILKNNENIIIAFKNIPYLFLYSPEGKILKKFNFRESIQNTELDGLWDQYDESKAANKLSNNLYFVDSTIEDSIIYIVTASWPNNGDAAYILRFKITDNEFKPLPVFRIQGIEKNHNLFNVIAVNDNTMIGYEGRSQAFFTFDLTELNVSESE